MEARELSLARFWSPRYWPVWVLWLWMKTTGPLPLRWQIRVYKRLGRLLASLGGKRYAVARRNLEVCFPELSEQEISDLVLRHFESLGASVAEMAVAWFSPIERLRRLIRVEGDQHLYEALREGKGAILFSAHFTTMEIAFAILEDLDAECSVLYRPQHNPMTDAIILRGRRRFASEHIPRDNVRAMLRNLKRNHVVVYMPDQTMLGKQSRLLPFFGEMAVTNVATGKIAKLSGAPVLPYFYRRLADDSGYVVEIGAPLANFPSADPIEDSRRLFGLLEERIRLAPEQYLWIYRKFKGRPHPYPDLYSTARRPRSAKPT
jgi:KDO2-lipid IV(A) lauroyltransferase